MTTQFTPRNYEAETVLYDMEVDILSPREFIQLLESAIIADELLSTIEVEDYDFE